MFIHQAFRDELKRIRPDLQTKFGLTDVDALPDETLITKLLEIFTNNNYPTSQRRIASDTWNDYYIYLILQDLKSIDDEFMWNSNWLFRRNGLVDLINTIEEEINEAILFKVGKVCRVCANDKLRMLNLSNLRDYIWRHFEVIGYEKEAFTMDPNEMINSLYVSWRYRKVYCKDWFDNKYVMPQCILVPTSIKDLKIHEEKIQLEKILYRLNDTAKYDLEVLTEDYSDKLRIFMDSSKKLQQKMTRDFTVEAHNILDIQLHLKDKLMKNKQITLISYVIGKELNFETVPLRCTDPEVPTTHYPVGRYKVWINLATRDLKIHNIDIGTNNEYQHPHIQGNGICCLWARVNPMRESYSKQDRVTLAWGIIAYIEHLNPSSVYRSMGEFQNKRSKIFQYQVDQKKTPIEYGEVESAQRPSDESLEPIATVAEFETLSLDGEDLLPTATEVEMHRVPWLNSNAPEFNVVTDETLTAESNLANSDLETELAQAQSDRIDAELDETIDEPTITEDGPAF